jgi:fumarate hydratase, class II
MSHKSNQVRDPICIEQDSLGELEVPADCYYGAQTERARRNFPIGTEQFPRSFIDAYARIKRAAARVNADLGLLDPIIADAISHAATDCLQGKLENQFPLVIWQTGSGTQFNMNMNEVLANRGSTWLKNQSKKPYSIHPNDHVNKGQSSNDTFPTAMHLVVLESMQKQLIPALKKMEQVLRQKSDEYASINKVGRTHLMDATPLSLGQVFAGYMTQIQLGNNRLAAPMNRLAILPIGGTAVGTGLNTHAEYAMRMCRILAKETGFPFTPAEHKLEGIASHDTFVELHGVLKTIAASLIKIANDIRWLGSGPRCGIGELQLPVNEPGSSIMPGKVNPTQAEALLMVCMQVMGNDVAINWGGSSGNFELNVCKPLILYNTLQSIRLLADGIDSFTIRCVHGIKPNHEKIHTYMENTLMLVTALSPHIGYDKSAQIATLAFKKGITLREAAISTGYVTKEQFDTYVHPETMINPHLE